jgi:hypothetical protein
MGVSATQAIEIEDEDSGAILRFKFDGSEIRASIQSKAGAKLGCGISQPDRRALNLFLIGCTVQGRERDV